MKKGLEGYIETTFRKNFLLVSGLSFIFLILFLFSFIFIRPYFTYVGLIFGVIGAALLTKGALKRPPIAIWFSTKIVDKQSVAEDYLTSFKYVAAGLFLITLSLLTQLLLILGII